MITKIRRISKHGGIGRRKKTGRGRDYRYEQVKKVVNEAQVYSVGSEGREIMEARRKGKRNSWRCKMDGRREQARGV